MSAIFRCVFPLLCFFGLDRPNGNWRDVQEGCRAKRCLLRHKTKGKSRMMNQNQAKAYYKKLFVNYPDVLSVEEATTLLGFKSQTAIIRRIHQHRIRCLKVGRSFMIPKEYLIDYLLDS